jgi:zinc transporter, ZIP family
MAAAILWSALATGTLLIGMVLAYRGVVSLRWTALVMAFGAGAIISAVAYQLVLPAAVADRTSEILVGVAVFAGALTYYFADRWVDSLGGEKRMDFDGGQSEGSGAAILLGSMLDGVPESLVLGLSIAHSPQVSFAFIFAVAISNVPQGLGGTAGMLAAKWPKPRITWLWIAVCVLSIVASAIGYGIGVLVPSATGAGFDAFAAGALLVMLTDSMIPESFQHGGREAGLALVVGFAVAVGVALLEAG